MTFVTYAQNFEDVMLWRALKDIENGFYIDVGANDPVIESVTKLFYDNGWSGINIEPIKSYYIELLDQRPRDINLNCAASNSSGSISLWECDIRGWATADDQVVAMHEANGYKGAWYEVPSFTLKEICDQHCNSQIHFMKIDVEGAEHDVLRGAENLIENAEKLGSYFAQQLRSMNSPHIKEIRSRGMMIGVEVTEESPSGRAYCLKLMEEGILAKETHDKTIRFTPPLVITKKDPLNFITLD